VVGPTTDLWAVASATGRFVIHICRYDDRHLADVFAGLWPAPGGPFATAGSSHSDWGPVLDELPDRAYCSFESGDEMGWSGLMVGSIDRVEVSELKDPMVHYRSGYRRLLAP
jgi:flavin reductase (DIM6/NTAB) family NADH-FMN oxidoreductase RutF